jgi:dipeptidyl aminopeptidase/acylaminoacyl peptidase
VWESSRRLVWVDRKGAIEPLPTPARAYLQPTLSSDGRRVAVTIEDSSNTDIWLADVARGTLTRMTFHSGEDFNAVWSPDGTRLVFSSETHRIETDLRGPALHALQADGSGGPELLIDTERAGVEFAGSFHPFEQVLGMTFWEQNASIKGYTGFEIRLVSLDQREELPLLETTFNEHSPMFAPDGRWFAYVSDETGRDEIYLRPYPGEGGKRSVSTDGGTEPLWAPNGDELFYRSGDKMMAVSIETDSELDVGSPEVLFEGRFATTHRPDTPRNYAVSEDGQRFLMVRTVDDPAPTQINVVLNWFEELERLVPTQ